MWIQVILIIAIVVIGLFFIRRPGSDSHLALRRLLLFAFIIAAVLSVLFPQWLSAVANAIGVGRGTDLLLYALVVVFLIYVSTQYRRNVELNRKLTKLSRRLALSDAKLAERSTPVDGAVHDERPTTSPIAHGEHDLTDRADADH